MVTPEITPRLVAGVIVAASVGALASAFFAQYVVGLEPCPLCLYQRYPYAAAIVIAGFALLVSERGRWPLVLIALAGAAFAVDAAIAFYHVGVEAGRFEGLAACGGAAGETPDTLEELEAILRDAPPPACDEVPWSLFGISMAGYNLIYAAVLAVATFAAAGALARRRSPR